MTDKQIIIDGVDVNGCPDISGHVNDFGEYECLCRCIFGDRSDNYGVISHEMCKDNTNSYYKQLKAKEQEFEELKEKNNQFDNGINEQFSKIIELEGRNNLLKAILAEIKEIAKNMNTECFYDDFDCKDCDMKNGCTYQEKIKILQKISKCEVNND